MVQTFTRALLLQFQHVAACNALHSVEARLARWLLHVHDRVDGDVLPLTQETLAEFLGVRRTTVTHVVCKLRASGAIRSNAFSDGRSPSDRFGSVGAIATVVPATKTALYFSVPPCRKNV